MKKPTELERELTHIQPVTNELVNYVLQIQLQAYKDGGEHVITLIRSTPDAQS